MVEQLSANRSLLDRHMDRILPFERTDSRVDRGFAPFRAGKRSSEEESGFRPSALRGGDGKYYARGGRATKGSFSQRDWRGGHGSEQGRQHDVTVQTSVHEFDDSGSKATPRKRLVKKSGDRERTPDFGIEDEEPTFMRDEFASEPPSTQKRKGSKEDEFRKKEKKLKGSLSAIYPGRDREMKELWDTVVGADSEDDQEGFIGDAPQLEKGHGTREFLDILFGKAVSYNPQAEVLWLRGAKEKWLAVRLTLAREILGQAYAALQIQRRFCLLQFKPNQGMSGVKINVKHLVPYYGDTFDDDNSRANSVHTGENDEVQELACKFSIG
ncbi:hypothetical protein Syun_029655 [Stephania yunnanensis]|uniref:Uncharacterized protein n=1 Tax=Stephania yunnanensis TaxID=152371 RepID=A0AAP0E609_9MAGN